MESSKLGTSATRGSTIETLFSRRYVTRKGTAINATERGLFLISQLRERKLEFLTQADTTKAWGDGLGADRSRQRGRTYRRPVLQSIKEKTEAIICTFWAAPRSRCASEIASPKTGLPVEEGPDGFVFPGFKGVSSTRSFWKGKCWLTNTGTSCVPRTAPAPTPGSFPNARGRHFRQCWSSTRKSSGSNSSLTEMPRNSIPR